MQTVQLWISDSVPLGEMCLGTVPLFYLCSSDKTNTAQEVLSFVTYYYRPSLIQRTKWPETVSASMPNYEILLFADVSLVLILLKIWLMLWPIVVRTKTAAAPIKTNNNEYSTMSWPCSSLINSLSIGFSPVLPDYVLKRWASAEVMGEEATSWIGDREYCEAIIAKSNAPYSEPQMPTATINFQKVSYQEVKNHHTLFETNFPETSLRISYVMLSWGV